MRTLAPSIARDTETDSKKSSLSDSNSVLRASREKASMNCNCGAWWMRTLFRKVRLSCPRNRNHAISCTVGKAMTMYVGGSKSSHPYLPLWAPFCLAEFRPILTSQPPATHQRSSYSTYSTSQAPTVDSFECEGKFVLGCRALFALISCREKSAKKPYSPDKSAASSVEAAALGVPLLEGKGTSAVCSTN